MEKKISATEAVRRFFEILNDIKYRGESYTIVRRGKRVPSAQLKFFQKRGLLANLEPCLRTSPGLEMKLRDLKEI